MGNNNILFRSFLSVIVLCVGIALSGCSDSKIESEINGKWSGKTTMTAEGEEIDMEMKFEFDKTTHNFKMITSFGSEGIELGKMKMSGSWKADKNNIYLDIDKDKAKFTFDSSLKALSALVGEDLEEYEREFRKEIEDEIGWDIIEIKSLSSNKLKLELDDDMVVTFKRVGKSRLEEDYSNINDISVREENLAPKHVESHPQETVTQDYEESIEPEYDTETSHLSGTVAGQNVVMELSFMDGQVTGRYRYLKINPPAWMTLEGDYDGENLNMTEYNPEGVRCGSFSCRVLHNSTPRKVVGDMVNYKGKKYGVELSFD